MASTEALAKRANLVASKAHWSHMELSESPLDQETQGSSSKDSVMKWLSANATEEDAKHEPLQKASEVVKRNTSCDDDLALGVEASLYGVQGVKTVKDFLRWTRSSPSVSRWNSFSSATSDHSGPLSVMDILNLWNDDPEEVLLDLGFGCDEPGLSGRIPARFINYQSQARGINLKVFLEAQKSRLDLENPDVSNRFRQIEVLQQVTTAFSSLLDSSSALRASQVKDMPPEARERKRRIAMLFKQASKKTLSQNKKYKSQGLSPPPSPFCAAPRSPTSPVENRIPSKRIKTGPMETMCLSPLSEEQGAGSDAQLQAQRATVTAEEGGLKPGPLREGRTLTTKPFLQRKRSPGQVKESFEMEEIHSFDESSATVSFMGGAENLGRCVVRTSSCQSDSSGFLEEPVIPSQSQQESPDPDLIKALLCLSGGSTDSHSSERPPSPSSPQTSPTFLPPSSLMSSSHCPSPDQALVIGSFQSPALLSVPESDLEISETCTAPEQDQSPPASLPLTVYEYFPPPYSLSELQDTNDQSKTSPLPAISTRVCSRSPPMTADSLILESGEIKEKERDSPSLTFSGPSSDSAACLTFSSISPPSFSSAQSQNAAFSPINSSLLGPEDKQSEQTEEYYHHNSLPANDGLSSNLPSCPSSVFHCSPSESLFSQCPENKKNDTSLQDLRGIRHTDSPLWTQMKEDAPSLCFELDHNKSLKSSTPFPNSSSSRKKCCPDQTISISKSALSTSPAQDSLKETKVIELRELSISQEDSLHCNNNNDSALTCPVQDIIPAATDHLSFDQEDTLQMNGEEERESDEHDTVQTSEAVGYISHTESVTDLSENVTSACNEVCNQKDMDPRALSRGLNDERSDETKPEDLTQVSQMEVDGRKCESVSSLVSVKKEVSEKHDRNEMERKGLFEIESLDLVFQTSVDGSEGENGDLDAYLQELDTERQVYWAEPVQVSDQNSLPEESDSFETSDESLRNCVLPTGPAVSDSFSSTGRPLSLSPSKAPNTVPANPDPKPSSCSVSVQMSSSPSSHIIHRKDVPFMTNLECTTLPTPSPLDTSTPFRAVQSWTDWQIKKNISKMFSHGAPDTVQNESMGVTGVSETARRPKLNSSSCPSLALLSREWQSYDPLPWMDKGKNTVSSDKGQWSGEEKEIGRNGYEDEKNLWESNQIATSACCCSCDHRDTCLYNKHTVANIPYSLDELEEMMLCLQQFCSVLNDMEVQLSEDQAAVFTSLSDQDREKVRDIEELRQAVKKEAGELEKQLNDLAHHYDDSLKMKMHRLLDEQSLLCTQLRVSVHGQEPSSLFLNPKRTVATQCCLVPWSASSWSTDTPKQSPPGTDSICEGLGSSPSKADKVDLLSFLQRLKESLRHSVNTDSVE